MTHHQTEGRESKVSFNWYLYYLSKRAYLLYQKSQEESVGKEREGNQDAIIIFQGEIQRMLDFSAHLTNEGQKTTEDIETITRIHLYLQVQANEEERKDFDKLMDLVARIFWEFYDELIQERMQTSKTEEKRAKYKMMFVSTLRTIETAKSREEAMRLLGMTSKKKKKPKFQRLKQDFPYIVVALVLVILLDIFLSNVGGWEMLISWFNT